MIDPIADLLTRIRNANKALLPDIEMPYSKMKESIAQLLKREGYLADCAVEGANIKRLKLKLKYQGRKGVIENLRRVSSSGLRRYVRSTDIPRVLGGMGTVVISTSRGVKTGADARKQNLGGELICYVW
ncbi:MAG: 30S ribosomal protein S8 [Limisphaerales bacterium]